MTTSPFWQTLGLGLIAGMRSMSAPALLSGALHQRPSARLAQSALGWLQSGAAHRGLQLLAGAEMLGDKLPHAPDRTAPISVLGRALAGAFVGAVLYKVNRHRVLAGAALGAGAAVAGTFGAFYLRKAADEHGGMQEPWTGVAEDALVVAGGRLLLYGE